MKFKFLIVVAIVAILCGCSTMRRDMQQESVQFDDGREVNTIGFVILEW